MKLDTYNVYLNNAVNSPLETSIKNAKQDQKELKEACQEFEAYFVNMMLKEMRKTVPKSTLINQSQGEEIFKEMLDQEYAKETSKGQGLGLAQMLYKQLSNKHIT